MLIFASYEGLVVLPLKVIFFPFLSFKVNYCLAGELYTVLLDSALDGFCIFIIEFIVSGRLPKESSFLYSG
jgi:hypothetical protein